MAAATLKGAPTPWRDNLAPWALPVALLIVAYTVYAVRLHDVTRQVLVSLDHLLTL